jgi:hypothetical protein
MADRKALRARKVLHGDRDGARRDEVSQENISKDWFPRTHWAPPVKEIPFALEQGSSTLYEADHTGCAKETAAPLVFRSRAFGITEGDFVERILVQHDDAAAFKANQFALRPCP